MDNPIQPRLHFEIMNSNTVDPKSTDQSLVIASEIKTDVHQEPTGVDNRLRAIFGKIAPQLIPLEFTHGKICIQYLRNACIADDNNDRGAYLAAISQMWDLIQSYRQWNKNTKTKKKLKKQKYFVDESTDDTSGSFDAINSFTERDILWISKYAEFGWLIAQVTKTESDNSLFWYLHTAMLADNYKHEFHYEAPLRAMRDKVQRYKQGLLQKFW